MKYQFTIDNEEDTIRTFTLPLTSQLTGIDCFPNVLSLVNTIPEILLKYMSQTDRSNQTINITLSKSDGSAWEELLPKLELTFDELVGSL